MKIKLVCFAILVSVSFSSIANFSLAASNVKNNLELSEDGCEIPAPETFHLKSVSSTWAEFEWTPEFVIPPTYRLKTYEVASGNLVNTTDVPGGVSIARVLGLAPGVQYRTYIHAVCSDGTENPKSKFVDVLTIIQELVVTGYSNQASTPSCTITSSGQMCPIFFNSNYVNVFQFETKGETSVSRYFYVDKNPAGDLRVRINSSESGTNLMFQCVSATNTYSNPFPSCQGVMFAIIHNGIEMCKFEMISTGSTTGFFKCNFINALGKNTIRRVSSPELNGNGDDRDGTIESTALIQKSLISPNPFTDHLNIQLPTLTPETPVNLALYDLQGRLVATQFGRNDNQMYTLPTENLKPGMYFLRIEAGGEVSTTKVVKTQ
jgi:Secretion system C-terminal sorting domain/Fibronectin type III domain